MGQKKRKQKNMGHKNYSSTTHLNPQPTQLPSTGDTVRVDFERAKSFFLKGNYKKALKIAEKSVSSHGNIKNSASLHQLKGNIFSKQASEAENSSQKLNYLRRAVDSAGRAIVLCPDSLDLAHFNATSLFKLAELTRDPEEYERVVQECRRGLSLENPENPCEYTDIIEDLKQELYRLSERCKVSINLIKGGTYLGTVKNTVDENPVVGEREIVEQKQEESESDARIARELKRRKELKRKESQKAIAERWTFFWASMNVESKREFMKVNIKKLKRHSEQLYGGEVRKHLEEGLDFAKKNKKWELWKCGTCPKKFLHCAAYKEHFEEEHATKLEPTLENVIPQTVDDRWAKMFSCGDWKPVDTVAALEMIKNRPEDENELVCEIGWSKDWPLTNDENRENILKEIHTILKMFVQCNCLSHSILSCVLDYTIGKLNSFVPQQKIADCGLTSTPQCICFLELAQLEELLWFLRDLAENSCANKVPEGDSFRNDSQVIDRVNFNINFSCLILGKRLLSQVATVIDGEDDDEALVVDDNCIVEFPQDNVIISWLSEAPMTPEEFGNLKSSRKNELARWFLCLHGLQSESKSLETFCRSKLEILDYNRALMKAEQLCSVEAECREKIPDYKWKTYASLLCKKCEELVRTEGANISGTTRHLLTVVRDIVEGSECPTLCELTCEDYSTSVSAILSEHQSEDDFVERSIQELKKEISNEIAFIDAKILLSAGVKDRLETHLMKLSAFDHRSIIFPLLKSFLREKLESDAKARSDASHAALLAEIKREGKKISKFPNDKKKDHRKTEDLKEPSSSDSIPLYQVAAEQEHSATYKCGSSANDSQLTREEDYRLKIEHEEGEKKMEEQLYRYPRMIVPPNIPAGEWHILRHPKNLKTKITGSLKTVRTREIENAFTEIDITEKDKVDRHVDHEASTSSDIDTLQKGIIATDFHPNEIDKSENTAKLKQEEVHSRLKVDHEEKSFMQEKLEKMEATEAKSRSDAAEAALLAVIELEKGKKTSNLRKGKKRDHRKTEDDKATSSASESMQLWQEEAEPEPSATYEYGRSINDAQLTQEEEEEEEDFRHEVEHEEWETKMEGQLEYPRMIISPNTPGGEWHTVKKKSKLPKGKRKDHRRTKYTEKTSSSKSIPLYQDAAVQQPFATYESGPSNKSDNAAELKQEKEDRRLKVEHEEKERKPEELVEHPGVTKNKFKEMDITEKDKVDGCIAEDAYNENEASTSFDIDTIQKGINAEDFTSTADFQPIKIDISTLLGTIPRKDAGKYNCALDMIVKSLEHVKIFREEVMSSPRSAHGHVGQGNFEEAYYPCGICALQDLFSALTMKQGTAEETDYFLLNMRFSLKNTHGQANGAAELLIVIFKSVHSLACPWNGSIIDLLFRLEETERMSCYNCRREPRFLERNSYSLCIRTNSLVQMKSVIGDIPFEKLLKVILMSHKMVCDPKTGGCGEKNYTRRILSRLPFVFTLFLEWGINRRSEDISATMMALANEIDVGMIYEGVTPEVKYKLVSMVGCDEKEYICIAYANERWIRHHGSITEVIGDWEDVVGLCRERKVWLEILFYEATWWFDK